MTRNGLWLFVAGFIAGIWVMLSIAPARSQNHHHPAADAQLHEQFYSNWMMPDNPTVSCCSLRDCYPTFARLYQGKWFARIRETGEFVEVPASKVEHNRDSPDGRNHLCANPQGLVFCFKPGGGT